MKPEYIKPTLAALRSGEYKQHRYDIGTSFDLNLCCIGVAAHANGFPNNITPSTAFDNDLGTSACAMYIGLSDPEIIKWVEWNDALKLSFLEIADKIEAEYGSGY